MESSFVEAMANHFHRAIAVQFFERKEKKEDQLVGGDIVFFF